MCIRDFQDVMKIKKIERYFYLLLPLNCLLVLIFFDMNHLQSFCSFLYVGIASTEVSEQRFKRGSKKHIIPGWIYMNSKTTPNHLILAQKKCVKQIIVLFFKDSTNFWEKQMQHFTPNNQPIYLNIWCRTNFFYKNNMIT